MKTSPQFRRGQVVTWVDPDEDNIMQPHVGRIIAMDEVTGERLYMIAETKDQFALVLEEELNPVRAVD